MKRLVLAAALTASLSGCATLTSVQDGAQVSAQAAKAGLDQICRYYNYFDTAFDVAASTGLIPAAYVAAEETAVDFIDKTCTNRPKDVITAFLAVRAAWDTALQIRAEFKAAK